MRNVFCLLLPAVLSALSFLPAFANKPWGSCQDGSVGRCSFAISAQSDAIAVGYETHAAVWDLRLGRYLPLLVPVAADGRLPEWRHAAFSNDGRYLAMLGSRLVVFDLREQQHRILSGGDGIAAVAFSPDGYLVTTGRRLVIWNIESAEKIGSLDGDLGDSDLLDFSADGILVVAFTEFDQTHLAFWDWSRKTLLDRHRYAKVSRLWFTQSGALYLQLPDCLIALDLATATNQLLYLDPVSDVPADGRKLALLRWVGSGRRMQREPLLIDLATRSSLIEVATPIYNLEAVKFFPDGRRVVLASLCGDLLVLDTAGRPLAKLTSQTCCYKVRTPDGRLETGEGDRPGQPLQVGLLQSLVLEAP